MAVEAGAAHEAPPRLTLAQLAPMIREALRDKTYQLYPMGQEAAGYLRVRALFPPLTAS